jgi:peptide/nickel transport system permease protein
MIHSPAWIVGRALVIVFISGLAGATLVRLAPGFGVDAGALDPRLSATTLAAIARQHATERSLLPFYGHFIGGMLRGDAGDSIVFRQPVGQLIADRVPATISLVIAGLGFGWGSALICAVAASLDPRVGSGSQPAATLAAMALSSLFLSIPAAVLATLCLLLRLSPAIAIAAMVFPRIFPHAHEQFRAGRAAPHVVMARARGLGASRLFLFHVVPLALMPLIALAGVSIPLAFGASIPVEALADVPGIGQLAWRAALGRDLPVLVAVTLLLTAITVVANLVADLVLARLARRVA